MNVKKENLLFVILFLFGLLSPDNNISYIIIGLSPIVLFLSIKNKSSFQVDKNLLPFFIVITISFVVASISSYGLEAKSVLRYFSFAALFLLFPFSPNLRVSNGVLYIAIGIIVLSQLAFSLGLNQIVSLIDTYYPYHGDKLGYNSDFLMGGAGEIDFMINRRYGGIYRNPNQAVRYVTLLFIVFLIENKNLNFIKQIPFISIVCISVLLSGSRTGLLLTLGLLFYSIYLNANSNNLKKIFLGLIIMVGFGFFYSFLSEFNLRLFEVTAGLDNSLGSKLEFFSTFFSNLDSPLNFLIGHFSSDNIYFLYGVTQLDSEWGELFYCFGLLGSIALILFYRKLFFLKDPNIRFFMLILLWGITSTILFSFKMSFLFMLLLSKYYSEFLNKKNL